MELETKDELVDGEDELVSEGGGYVDLLPIF